MKKVLFVLAVGLTCLTACAQNQDAERGPRQGGGMSVNKETDSTFVAEGYDGTTSFTLVLLMADASTDGKL